MPTYMINFLSFFVFPYFLAFSFFWQCLEHHLLFSYSYLFDLYQTTNSYLFDWVTNRYTIIDLVHAATCI